MAIQSHYDDGTEGTEQLPELRQVDCPHCMGEGVVRGVVDDEEPCPRCGGIGYETVWEDDDASIR